MVQYNAEGDRWRFATKPVRRFVDAATRTSTSSHCGVQPPLCGFWPFSLNGSAKGRYGKFRRTASIHAGYNFTVNETNMDVRLSAFNILNTVYLSNAQSNDACGGGATIPTANTPSVKTTRCRSTRTAWARLPHQLGIRIDSNAEPQKNLLTSLLCLRHSPLGAKRHPRRTHQLQRRSNRHCHGHRDLRRQPASSATFKMRPPALRCARQARMQNVGPIRSPATN